MAGGAFPKTIVIIYIAAQPERVWTALTDPAFTRQYFFGFNVALEPRAGGSFFLRMENGKTDVSGEVLAWEPSRRLSVTWQVEGMKHLTQVRPSHVTYDIEPAGDVTKLTVTEAHQWEVPDALLQGGREGWPLILSSLKSLLETGKPIVVPMKPPAEMLEAIKALR